MNIITRRKLSFRAGAMTTEAFLWAGAGVFALIIAVAFIFRKSAPSAREMSGTEFEDYAALLLDQNGIEILEATKASGDFGADLIVLYEGERTAVQCKRYSGKVGVRAVQEALSSMSYYKCSRAAVLTNSSFTRQARELALESGVILWDGEKLAQLEHSAGRSVKPRRTAPLRVHRLESGRLCEETLLLSAGRELFELLPHSVTVLTLPCGKNKLILRAGKRRTPLTLVIPEEGAAAAAGCCGKKPFLAEIAVKKHNP